MEYFYESMKLFNVTEIASLISSDLTSFLKCILALASAILIIDSICLNVMENPPDVADSYLNSE